MAATAVREMREPLSRIYPENAMDISRPVLPPSAAKLMQRTRPERFVRKSASMGSSRNVDVTVTEANGGAETRQTSSTLGKQDQSVQTDIHVPAEVEIFPVKEDEQENAVLLQLKIEAMTWAALAKDYTITSLERRLKAALKIAKAEQEKNEELEKLLRESKMREAATVLELQDSQAQIEQLADAEERLCLQLGDFEVEAVEEDQRHQSEVTSLTDRLEAQQRFISSLLEESKAGRRSLGEYTHLSEAHHEKQQQQQRSSSAAEQQLEVARKEIESLRAELNNAWTEIRTSQQQKRNLSKRLKALEKERRQFLRKVALQRSTSEKQRKGESEAPGGAGWKVFSILEFED